jgi:uncharacterized membrane protein YoaK (UPF0700 family)
VTAPAPGRPGSDLHLAVGLTALLAAVSGCVDVVALVYAGVFVANQTGNLVVVAAASLSSSDRVLLAVTALVSFTMAVVAGAYGRRAIASRSGAGVARLWLLGAEWAVLLVAAVLVATRPGEHGPGLVAPIALLAASQGVQAILVTRLLGRGVRTVAVTGSLTDALVGSVEAAADPERRRDPARRQILRLAAATPAGYALGAAAGALAVRAGVHLALAVALALAVVAAALVHRADSDGIDLA